MLYFHFSVELDRFTFDCNLLATVASEIVMELKASWTRIPVLSAGCLTRETCPIGRKSERKGNTKLLTCYQGERYVFFRLGSITQVGLDFLEFLE